MKNLVLVIFNLLLLISCNSKSDKKMLITKNETSIHDIWSAVRIDGYPINRMVTVPILEINTTEMKIFGNDGCNNYFGTISSLTEKSISFKDMGNTKKMCQNMAIPDRYLSALSKVKNYAFKNKLLILSDADNTEALAFSKVD